MVPDMVQLFCSSMGPAVPTGMSHMASWSSVWLVTEMGSARSSASVPVWSSSAAKAVASFEFASAVPARPSASMPGALSAGGACSGSSAVSPDGFSVVSSSASPGSPSACSPSAASSVAEGFGAAGASVEASADPPETPQNASIAARAMRRSFGGRLIVGMCLLRRMYTACCACTSEEYNILHI